MNIVLSCLLLLGITASALADECYGSAPGPNSAYLLPASMLRQPPAPDRAPAWIPDPPARTVAYSRRDYFPNPGDGADRRDPYANWLNTGNPAGLAAFPASERLLDKLISRRDLHRGQARTRRARARTLLFGLLAMGLGARR